MELPPQDTRFAGKHSLKSVPSAPGIAHSHPLLAGANAPSLRANFGWTFAGNAIYAAGQWAALSLFAKLGGAEMLGEYVLALALTAPLVMLSHLNLRTVLVTDTARHHAFSSFLAVRIAASALALAAIAIVAVVFGDNWHFGLAVVLTGAGQVAETFSDLYYGALQRREQLRVVAQSMIVRTVVSLAALGLALWAAGDLLPGVLALAVSRVAVLLLLDVRAGASGEAVHPTARSGWRAILRQALPLGIVLMLISLNTHLPRYAVERYFGASQLGGFAAVVTFITVGSTLMNALGQSATARLARHFHDGNLPAFRGLLARITAMAAALGVLGVAAAALLGGTVLRLVYREEFAAYHGLLTGAMAAGTFAYIAIALGYGVTSARIFDAQLPLFAVSVACCATASWLLVPHWGLAGGVMALAVATVPQITGQLYLLHRAMQRQEVSS